MRKKKEKARKSGKKREEERKREREERKGEYIREKYVQGQLLSICIQVAKRKT